MSHHRPPRLPLAACSALGYAASGLAAMRGGNNVPSSMMGYRNSLQHQLHAAGAISSNGGWSVSVTYVDWACSLVPVILCSQEC